MVDNAVEIARTLAVDLALFFASVLSGMLGIGVAFAAIPILSFNGGDLVHELQPAALFLNGITALFAAIAFSRAGYVDWGRSLRISAVATLISPLGAYFAQLLDARFLWTCYLGAAVAVLFLISVEQPEGRIKNWFGYALAATVPISAFSAMLGVGPGFLLVPVLIRMGMRARNAAAMNAVAVVPSSFSALIPHIGTASPDVLSYWPIVVVAAAGALIGGSLASYKVADRSLRYLFVTVMFCLALYKGITLFSPQEAVSVFSDRSGIPLFSVPASTRSDSFTQ